MLALHAHLPPDCRDSGIFEDRSISESRTRTKYTYDAGGNRLSSASVGSYTYNSSNELTSTSAPATYAYDNNGNTLTKTDSTGTTTYSWDFENRLVKAILPTGATVHFAYDPFGRRIQKDSTWYVYDGADVLEEFDSTGMLSARYTNGPGIDEPLAVIRAGVVSFYEADGLGSITSLTKATGTPSSFYSYDSFGNLITSGGRFALSNLRQYTGREFDGETGLYYYRARYYNPQTGRFLSEDPARSGDNFYDYVRNDPPSGVDPFGLWDTQTHSTLYWNALRGCGLDNAAIWLIQQESAQLDADTQWPWEAYIHSMRAPWQSPADALAERDQYVSKNLDAAAWTYQQVGNAPWLTYFARALHTLTDSTSPAHMQNGVPQPWPSYPNALEHGDEKNSVERWGNMTPELEQKNIELIRNAFQRATGQKCGCNQEHNSMYWKYETYSQ